MKAKPDCIVCTYRQALNAARVAGSDPDAQVAILAQVATRLGHPSLNQTPAALSQCVYEAVADVSGIADPYARIKQATNAEALRLLPELEALVRAAPDPLREACRLAIAGNIVDLGIGHLFDLERDVRAILRQPFAIDDYADFRRAVRPGCRALYLGDNSGEIVFDRVLVEHLLQAGTQTTFVVKDRPIINDATLEDARFCGLTDRAPVITTGSNDIGVYWERTSAEFQAAFARADLVIAKGHGNFETCVDHAGNFFFLLKAKCEMVAQELGVRLNDLVFAHYRDGRRKQG
jgi:uncharacterized protein with ATP-grasp and redox domains